MNKKLSLIPIFFISAAAVGFELILTRYFSIVSWSEYSYWVISITMVGFAVSGVILSIFKDFFEANIKQILSILPLLLLFTATAGYIFMTLIPFNPLEFQNSNTWLEQLQNIWKYYAALFPFFFLAGIYIGTYFLSGQRSISKIYGADLFGAGVGTVIVLYMMFYVHPFMLLGSLLPLLFLASCFQSAPKRINKPVFLVIFIFLLICCEFSIYKFNQADFNQYKAIFPSLHVEGNKIINKVFSPLGYFMTLDNFTERLDTDFSNNAGLLHATEPPKAYGLYKDGNRIASLPKDDLYEDKYIPATLDVFPYYLKPHASTLLIGTQGGFKMLETKSLDTASITALEPDPVIYSMISKDNSIADLLSNNPSIKFIQTIPLALAKDKEQYGIIDVASNFLSQSDSNKYIFTKEELESYIKMLKPDGVLSIPDSIKDSTSYSLKIIETLYQTLEEMGITSPEKHIIVYRSSWNDRILVSPSVFTQSDIKSLSDFTNQRSFDISYYGGITKDINVWNDLPPVSFEPQVRTSEDDIAQDSLRDDIMSLFSEKHDEFIKNNFFRITESTLNQPDYYSILRLSKLKSILNNLSLVPEHEMGALVSVAVLAQSILIAIIILFLPLLRWRKYLPRAKEIIKPILYFASLGLGFFFFEIYLIGKATFFLNDSTYGFAAILTSMLIFSGVGSFLTEKYLKDPQKILKKIGIFIVLWAILLWFLLDPLLLALISLSIFWKCLVLLIISAPLSIALGFPFALGLSLFRDERDYLLPWAWSINGAFSVIATPLANIVILSLGYKFILALSAIIYIIVVITYPNIREKHYEK